MWRIFPTILEDVSNNDVDTRFWRVKSKQTYSYVHTVVESGLRKPSVSLGKDSGHGWQLSAVLSRSLAQDVSDPSKHRNLGEHIKISVARMVRRENSPLILMLAYDCRP